MMKKTESTQLSKWRWIKVTGDDRVTFLHGQLTNSISGLTDGENCLAGYCDPKGRLLALLYVHCTNNEHYLLLPTDIFEATLKRLRMFVMRSKVVFEDITADVAINAYSNQFAAPDNSTWLSFCEQAHVLIQPMEDVSNNSESALTEADLAITLIKAGVPVLAQATVGEFVPQWINLDVIDGLNFKKGCYPGQEIVARTHYLGKLKKRMYILSSVSPGSVPEVGSSLYIANESQAAGTIVNAATEGKTHFALAVLRIEQAASASGYSTTAEMSDEWQLVDLPYAFPAPREVKKPL